MNEDKIKVTTILNYVILFTISFIIGYLICYHTHKPLTPPVGETVKVDSIIKVNDSLKLEVKQLDSIKDAKVIEVKSLDNDSTAKLFYELISK